MLHLYKLSHILNKTRITAWSSEQHKVTVLLLIMQHRRFTTQGTAHKEDKYVDHKLKNMNTSGKFSVRTGTKSPHPLNLKIRVFKICLVKSNQES